MHVINKVFQFAGVSLFISYLLPGLCDITHGQFKTPLSCTLQAKGVLDTGSLQCRVELFIGYDSFRYARFWQLIAVFWVSWYKGKAVSSRIEITGALS